MEMGKGLVTDSVDGRNRCQLIESNKRTFNFFRWVGLFLVQWDTDPRNDIHEKYVVNSRWFIIYCTLWFLWHLLGATIGLVWKYTTEVPLIREEWEFIIEILVSIIAFLIIPSAHLIILYRTIRYLPEILRKITILERVPGFPIYTIHLWNRNQFDTLNSNEVIANEPQDCVDGYQSLDKQGNDDFSNESHKHLKLVRDIDDDDDEPIQVFFSRFPTIIMIISCLIFIGFSIYAFITVFAKEWEKISHEWNFIIILFFIVLPMFEIWFCVFFIEWNRIFYKKITQLDPSVFNKKVDILNITKAVGKTQEIFSMLNNTIFKLTLGISFLVLITSSIICSSKILEGFHEIFYVILLGTCFYHLYIVCSRSSDLLEEFISTKKMLKKRLTEHIERIPDNTYSEIQVLRHFLEDSPPEVQVFGGFRVNFEIMTAFIGFVFSYAAIVKSFQDTNKEQCYKNTNTSQIFCLTKIENDTNYL